jgi:hypothetical protein
MKSTSETLDATAAEAELDQESRLNAAAEREEGERWETDKFLVLSRKLSSENEPTVHGSNSSPESLLVARYSIE